jgi:hypothetical protein
MTTHKDGQVSKNPVLGSVGSGNSKLEHCRSDDVNLWEQTKERPRSLSGVKINGERLVRFVYVDESGISVNEPVVVVAGVIINADLQWRAVEKHVSQLIDEYVPEEHRKGFVFHAKDLFHGSGLIFDRRKYPLERSREALKDLLSIPRKFLLPVVYGYLIKRSRRLEVGRNQSMAYSLCAVAVEAYMRSNADFTEVAALVAENNTDTRRAVKVMHDILKGKYRQLESAADIFSLLLEYAPNVLPVRRIVDTVYFAEKNDVFLLQIADACGLIIRYFKERKANVEEFFDALTNYNPKCLDTGGDMPAGYASLVWT